MLDEAGVRGLRWRAQRLAPRDGSGDPVAVVRAVAAIQSQDPGAAALALRARGAGFTAADVERARVEDRSLIRTRWPRDTIHLVATEDADWTRRLLAPAFLEARARRRHKIGLDDDLVAAARTAIPAALQDGPRTRGEIGERLRAGGLDVSGQQVDHLVSTVVLDGVVCDGPDQGHDRTWVLLRDWADVPEGPSGDVALAELARRHLAGHGPADPRDLAAWAGLAAGEGSAAARGPPPSPYSRPSPD